MTNNHWALIAGAAIGFFLLSGKNTYGAGKWGQSTLGTVYNQAASIAAPAAPAQ
jgi:hypothetical protein